MRRGFFRYSTIQFDPFSYTSAFTDSDLIVDSNWDVYRQQCRDGEGIGGGGGIGGIVPGGGEGMLD